MSLEEIVLGVRKANLDERRELKVKVPVRLLVNLHYLKLTEARGISEIVNQALSEFFASHANEFRSRGGSEPDRLGTPASAFQPEASQADAAI